MAFILGSSIYNAFVCVIFSDQGIKTLLRDFVVPCASTGTDWSTDWGEQCSYWEANCRGEQEEGLGWKVSGTLICGLIIVQHHNISWLSVAWFKAWKANDYQKTSYPQKQKSMHGFLKELIFKSFLSDELNIKHSLKNKPVWTRVKLDSPLCIECRLKFSQSAVVQWGCHSSSVLSGCHMLSAFCPGTVETST